MRLLTLLFAAALSAQDKPDLEKLTSIAGDWTGKIGRAVIEEQWLPPAGVAMLGLSRTIAARPPSSN